MKKVLIIEDDHIVGNIYRHKFQMEGFQVALAADGEMGFNAVADFQPDVVILDLMLPKMNGVEVLRRIRARPDTANLPVIVLSNAYLSNLVQDAWSAGANQCLIKANCTPKHVIEVLYKLLPPPGTLPAPAPAATPAPADPAPTPGASTATPPPPPAGRSSGTAPTPASTADDNAFQAELRQTFLQNGPEVISQLRSLLQTFVKSEGDTVRLPNLFTLYRRVHSVTSNAAVAGLGTVSRLCAALEALLKELYEKPKNINASTVRTIAHTVDFLHVVLDHASSIDPDSFPPPNILVVDDEAISRRAVIYALEKANLKCASTEDPLSALHMLEENRFDLIFLDVDMPGLNGFEVCARLRTYPTNVKTPVIFVTGLTDFESRARSTLSGGSDLIAKPFLFMELAVKAITHILKAQLSAARG